MVQGNDNSIYYRLYNSTTESWNGWNVVPSGTTTKSPAATVALGKLFIIVNGADGHSLWFSSITIEDSSFSGWSSISGTSLSPTNINKQ